MTEYIYEVMDFCCIGGRQQLLPDGNNPKEEIVRCCNCYFCDYEKRYEMYHCNYFDRNLRDTDGFCAWGKKLYEEDD